MSRYVPTSRRPICWLMLTVLTWGVYLAFGVSRFARDISDSMWKGTIVCGCVVAFLGPWAVVLLVQRGPSVRSRDMESSETGPDAQRSRWSATCVASLVLAALAGACLVGYQIDALGSRSSVAWSLAWTTLLPALILAVIGLSDPRRRRGKWMAMVAMMAIVGLAFGWLFLQSSPSAG